MEWINPERYTSLHGNLKDILVKGLFEIYYIHSLAGCCGIGLFKDSEFLQCSHIIWG